MQAMEDAIAKNCGAVAAAGKREAERVAPVSGAPNQITLGPEFGDVETEGPEG